MRIRWTDPAVRDLTHICDYIEKNQSALVARRVAFSIYERANALETFPEKGRSGRVPGTRELIFSSLPYLAIYPVKGKEDVVEILRVLHGAQAWP